VGVLRISLNFLKFFCGKFGSSAFFFKVSRKSGRRSVPSRHETPDKFGFRRKMKIMSREVTDLLKRALALSADERAALANTLLDSLETSNESVQEAWDEEVARRMEDLKAGKAVTVPWEQLHRELLAMVNER
jgi:putative addiction module component (TIGR02574 family)